MSVTFNPFTGNLDFNDTTKASGSDTQIQFNDGGKLSGDSGLVFNKTTDALTIAGPVIHPLGAAATPSLTFTGDLNTGIYSPGADQVAISTNGTGRLFVDASGNIGVGVASPVTTLHLQKPTGGLAGIQVSTSTHGSTLTDGLFVGIDNSIGYLFNYENLPLVFGTNATERMRLTSAGLLGLGTSSPDALLTVNGVGAFGAGTAALPSIARSSDLDTGAWFPAANTIAASTAGVERLRIDSTGRVGIGTTSPGETLDIGSGTLRIRNSSGDTNGLRIYQDTGDTSRIYNFYGGPLAFGTTNTERARIDSSGRLLVGTSSSSAGIRLAIQGNSASATGTAIAYWQAGSAAASITSGSGIGDIAFTDNDGNRGAQISATADGNWGSNDYPSRLVFFTAAAGSGSLTERLRITNAGVLQVADAGNIAVGTTTGTKIGTATTQKLGFYNATPVVQPTAVADATDAASVITQLNALLSRMRTLGLIAT